MVGSGGAGSTGTYSINTTGISQAGERVTSASSYRCGKGQEGDPALVTAASRAGTEQTSQGGIPGLTVFAVWLLASSKPTPSPVSPSSSCMSWRSRRSQSARG